MAGLETAKTVQLWGGFQLEDDGSSQTGGIDSSSLLMVGGE